MRCCRVLWIVVLGLTLICLNYLNNGMLNGTYTVSGRFGTSSVDFQSSTATDHNDVWQGYNTALAEEKRQKLEEGCSDSAAMAHPGEPLVPIWPESLTTPIVWATAGFPHAQKKSGKFYYEVALHSAVEKPQFGWLSDAFKSGPYHEGVGFDEYGWAADGVRNMKWHNGGTGSWIEGRLWPRQWIEGDIIGLALDIDEGQMFFSINGQWVPDASMGFVAGVHAFFPAVSTAGKFSFHIGKGSWKFAGPSSDYWDWFDAVVPIARPVDAQVFEAVDASLPLRPPFLKYDPAEAGAGQGEKNIVGLEYVTRGRHRCLVYGFGIAFALFETEMHRTGCETHAFDCTVDPNSRVVSGQPFTFHHWCVGSRSNVDFANNLFVGNDSNISKLQFKSLTETMDELGHTHIDLLRFDVEGFEWQLFETEILPNGNPPVQLSFELHTKSANPVLFPPSLVQGKGYTEVNQLFRSLYDKGYRVVSKEVNSRDLGCADFVLLKKQ